ncbi:MAG: DUF551 domain-containing protein [Ruminococcus sp.]|nr:DUF551 domain-containing protein [Ruminococcus sp.]
MRKIDADEFKSKLMALIAIYESRMPAWSPNNLLTSGRDAAMKFGAKADGVEKALELLERMPTIETEPAKWISTEEELPPKGCEVLVCDFDDYTAVGVFNGCKWVVEGFEASTPPVSHWQPLPKPPRKASKKSSLPFSFGCSSCKHEMNCKDREKCGRENGSGYEPCKPSPSKEEKLARLTKFSEIFEHYGSEAQLGKLMQECAHVCGLANKCRERGIEISDELNEHAAEVVALIMQIYTHAPLYWIGELEKAIDEIIERETKKIEVENEKNT